MKKLFLLLTILGMVAVGCTTEGGNEQNNNHLSFTDETNTNPTVVAGGGMVNISFTTEYDWQITSDVDWLTTSKTSGVGGSVDFFITASPNKSDKERKGTITITLSNGNSYEIVVTQEPNEGIKHLVCQANEILYTTKYNYVIEKDFAGVTGFGDTNATLCVESGYDGTYGYIRFNNDVTKIPAGAFAGCTSVEAIYLPDGVQEVGRGAFGGCTALHSIYSINSVDDYKALVIDGTLCAVAPAKLTEHTIPAGITKIGAGAFSGCKTLKKVVIPEGVKEIEAGAFEDCENLEYIKIPNSLTIFGGDIITGTCNENFGLDISSDHPNVLIYATSDNKPISLNNDANILAQTFSNGIGLVFYWKLQIPSSAFYSCNSLTNVGIPDCVTSIGYRAFYNCDSLTSVVIPDSVTSIGEEAFLNCDSLTSVTIGNGVTSIGESAFYGCRSLKEIYCKPTTPPAGGSEMFDYNASGRKIYVPRASVDAYKSPTYWRNYSSCIVGYDFNK